MDTGQSSQPLLASTTDANADPPSSPPPRNMAANAEISQRAEDGSTAPTQTNTEKPIEDLEQTPDSAEVLRIIGYDEKAYYEILNLKPDATMDDIKKAYRKKANLVHTDKSADPNSQDACRMVIEAHKHLSNEASRRAYDLERPKLEAEGRLAHKHIGENFSKNAQGDESGSESGNDDEYEDDEWSDKKKKLIEKIERSIVKAFKSRDEDQLEKAVGRLNKLSAEMVSLNEAENGARKKENEKNPGEKKKRMVDPRDLTPPVYPIKKRVATLLEQKKALRESVKDTKKTKEIKTQIRLDRQSFENYLAENDFPGTWLYDEIEVDPSNTRSSRRSKAGNQRTGKQSATTSKSPDDKMDYEVSWKAGETTKGEKILGYAAKAQYGRSINGGKFDGIETNHKYVIEVKDSPGMIEVGDENRVGVEAANAYQELPQEQRNNITHIQDKANRFYGQQLADVVGATRDNFTPGQHNYYYRTYLLVYNTTEQKPILLNRSALRKSIGPRQADERINNFFVKRGITPDVPKSDRGRLMIQNVCEEKGIEFYMNPQKRIGYSTRSEDRRKLLSDRKRWIADDERSHKRLSLGYSSEEDDTDTDSDGPRELRSRKTSRRQESQLSHSRPSRYLSSDEDTETDSDGSRELRSRKTSRRQGSKPTRSRPSRYLSSDEDTETDSDGSRELRSRKTSRRQGSKPTRRAAKDKLPHSRRSRYLSSDEDTDMDSGRHQRSSKRTATGGDLTPQQQNLINRFTQMMIKDKRNR